MIPIIVGSSRIPGYYGLENEYEITQKHSWIYKQLCGENYSKGLYTLIYKCKVCGIIAHSTPTKFFRSFEEYVGSDYEHPLIILEENKSLLFYDSPATTYSVYTPPESKDRIYPDFDLLTYDKRYSLSCEECIIKEII